MGFVVFVLYCYDDEAVEIDIAYLQAQFKEELWTEIARQVHQSKSAPTTKLPSVSQFLSEQRKLTPELRKTEKSNCGQIFYTSITI